jgi:hypothetical protein
MHLHVGRLIILFFLILGFLIITHGFFLNLGILLDLFSFLFLIIRQKHTHAVLIFLCFLLIMQAFIHKINLLWFCLALRPLRENLYFWDLCVTILAFWAATFLKQMIVKVMEKSD